ncbi:GNAT family N-acetyltransferase [Hoeflea poritis]|uniref:GNAT family N-acetyltransferase n=1 Tax=Hoeflea poritis TaxID=2993659 RepID=A0ABT4VLE4_9HYPH|nr:GNAT family N-acetyltransferase [Hoeflea poritis]MDA4845524.1 GNAT family N-acetyltransferase [Hoeflea poritis]
MGISKLLDGRLHIRPAEKADIGELLELYGELNPGDRPLSPGKAGAILEQLSNYPGSAVLIGLSGNEMVSTCTLVVVPNLTRGGAPYALIENVVTRNRHRQCGFGRLILEEAVSRAWEFGCYKAMLLTGSRDPGTLKFYARAGFEQSKTGFQIRRIPKKDD